MLFNDTKAFVMQLPDALAQTVEQMAGSRGYSTSLVLEQALREWVGRQGSDANEHDSGRPGAGCRAEAEARRLAEREEREAWGASIDAEAAPA